MTLSLDSYGASSNDCASGGGLRAPRSSPSRPPPTRQTWNVARESSNASAEGQRSWTRSKVGPREIELCRTLESRRLAAPWHNLELADPSASRCARLARRDDRVGARVHIRRASPSLRPAGNGNAGDVARPRQARGRMDEVR